MKRWLLPLLIQVALGSYIASANEPSKFSWRDSGDAIAIRRGETPVATYVYSDDNIRRPFFANVRSVGGIQVTRNFPPDPKTDLADHPTMHPGIWIAFGDIDGNDFWRNKGVVRHHRFIEGPAVEAGAVKFVEEKLYAAPDGQNICREVFRCRLSESLGGILIEFDSTFSSDHDFYFGDQEEMGLGIRVRSDIAEKRGGRLSDGAGRKGADQIWSESSSWCDYSGPVKQTTVGLTLLCHPGNQSQSWMHARDYGLVAANAFGRAAMGKGPTAKTMVPAGESLRLRYGVWVHEGAFDPAAAFQAYAGKSP